MKGKGELECLHEGVSESWNVCMKGKGELEYLHEGEGRAGIFA